MQAVLSTQTEISNNNLTQTLERLFSDLDTADNMTKMP